jgi:hypothetical protein
MENKIKSKLLLSEKKSAVDSILSRPFIILLVIFFLAVAVRSVPLRFDGMFDPDSHFHARMSNEIARSHELLSWDALSLQGRVYSYPPLLHILVGFLAALTNTDALLVLKVFGVLVGGLLTFSTFLLARLFSKSNSVALWSALFVSLSSIVVYRTAAHTRPDGLAIALIPFLLYLWLTRREKGAAVLSLALVLLHPLSTVVYGVLLGVWLAWGLFRKISFPLLLPLTMVGMVILFSLWVWSIGLPFSSYSSKLLSEASELVQFPLIAFILYFPLSWMFAAVGSVKAKLPLLLVSWLLVGIVLGAFGMRFAMYFVPFFSIVAGFGVAWVFSKLVSDTRTLPVFLVFFVVLGVLSVFVMMNGIHSYVKDSEKPALDFLRENGKPGDAILSSWDQGHVLTYYTKLPVVIDGYFEFAHELEERNNAWKNVFSSSSCQTILGSVDAFHARFVYLSRDEVTSPTARTGILELQNCPGLSLVFASDGARVYERAYTNVTQLKIG